jgi:hypothetical protein
MGKKLKVLEFEVKSTDPGRRTIDAVRETIRLSGDLQQAVEKNYPGVKVKIKRAEGVPVHELIHHLLVSIDWHAVASGAEVAIGQFAASEFLKLTKDRIRNLFASPVNETKPAARSAKKAPTKTQPARKRIAEMKASRSKGAPAKAISAKSKPAGKKPAGKSKGIWKG